METLIGIFVLYSFGHFGFIQASKTWKDRTTYEKFVTVVAIVGVIAITFAIAE